MKPAVEWDENYVLSLPVGEFDWLELKGRKALDLTLPNVKQDDVFDTLGKAISAFANSGGGQLVYGAKNPSSASGGVEIDDGGISTNIRGKTDTREWLEDVIPNLVEFPLTEFNVYAILPATPQSLIAPGRAIYIIDFRDSTQAPHQSTRDRVYYARVGGKSRPIGHRLVIDIVNRRQHPKIELEFTLERTFFKGVPEKPSDLFAPPTFHLGGAPPKEDTNAYSLRVVARNTGRVYAQYVNCYIEIPAVLLNSSSYGYDKGRVFEIEGQSYVRMYEENTTRDYIGMSGLTRQYGPARFDPILPGLGHVWDIKLKSNIEKLDLSALKIRWTSYADSAAPLQGETSLQEIPIRDIKRPNATDFEEDDD